MLLVLLFGIKCVKLGISVIGRPLSVVVLFILVAIDVKYSLKAFAIFLRSVIRSLLMTN